MTGCVVDASVALAWCFVDEASAYADAVLLALEGQQVLVPAIWPLELTNAIVVAERRKRIGQPEILRFVELLQGIQIRQDSVTLASSAAQILPLARKYGLSAYDAAYLELAIRHTALLATSDHRLETAAREAGVELFSKRRSPRMKR